MQHKKTQLAPQHETAPTLFGARSGRQSFMRDLRSIISAAHKLPAEVALSALVWRSLCAQLEREGVLSRAVKS